MVLSIPQNAEKLWESWNIRGFIILSLSVQTFLILCTPLRKQRWGKWGTCIGMLIWSGYLLADWVAGVTIGLILRNEIKSSTDGSDIQVFWAPFLLLHLGGPDTITSFALEDNEFWVLGLALQVGSTLYVFIMSLPENNLWLPTLLVLIAGIIKYAERNRAFYLASFDHLGDNWVPSKWEDELPIPVQFKNIDNHSTFDFDQQSILWSAAHHFGSIKRILVGPVLSLDQCSEIGETFHQEKPDDVLRIMEIELSLLYEVLHTKLPVVDSKYGYFFRVINLGCILGALLSFSFFKKQHKLGLFDISLTYVMLIWALALDLISIILQIFICDWIFIAHNFQNMGSKFINKFINRRRWSKVVSQLNFFTYHIKDHPSWLKSFSSFLHIKSLLEAIKGIRCLSFQKLDDKVWHFIFYEVKQLNGHLIRILKESSKTVLEGKEVWLCSRDRVLKNFRISEELTQIIEKFDYTESILTWHIATELCFRAVDQTPISGNGSIDHYKGICKKFSDYMFYLAVLQPSMMAAVSVNWKIVFEGTLAQTESLVPWSSISNEKDICKKILQLAILNSMDPEGKVAKRSIILQAASELASQLLKQPNGPCPWEPMSKVWVQLMCFAAINCRPNVHAQQPSKGGELLTFVWLFMNHLGLGTHFSTHY